MDSSFRSTERTLTPGPSPERERGGRAQPSVDVANARILTAEVYIPINIALTKLFNSYERFASTFNLVSKVKQKVYRDSFETECLSYLQTIDDLSARGADAYLTTAIDEQLNDLSNFVRNSLDQNVVRKRRVLQATFRLFRTVHRADRKRL